MVFEQLKLHYSESIASHRILRLWCRKYSLICKSIELAGEIRTTDSKLLLSSIYDDKSVSLYWFEDDNYG